MFNEQLVVMDFPIGEKVDRDTIVRSLLDRRSDIENTFKNDEYLKLDLTHQEILGVKSSSYMGNVKIGDLPLFGKILSKNERYKNADIKNLGNVNMLYKFFMDDKNG